MASVRRRLAVAALTGTMLVSFGAAAFLVRSALDDSDGEVSLPVIATTEKPTTTESAATVPTVPVTLPVPAPLADGFLSMRAGPVVVPIELQMPTLGVTATVLGVGVTDRNVMDAPKGPADDNIWRTAFWYRGSATPGETSTALIAGHAEDPLGRPGVFGQIQNLHPGDPIVVRDTRTGLDVRFAVAELQIYSLTQSETPEVVTRIYGAGPAVGAWPTPAADGLAHLTLITCAGTYRSADGTHDHRLVVYATRIS